MSGQSLDDEFRESLLQLLELAERQRAAGQLSEAGRAYREVVQAAEQEHLQDLAERGQHGLSQLLSAQRLAEADAALRDRNLVEAEAAYREVYEKLARGDDRAAAGLAQVNFLLGQQAETDERPFAARDYYAEAYRLDPSLLQVQARLMALAPVRRRHPWAKALWAIIPVALALVAVVVLSRPPQPAPGASAAVTRSPTATSIAVAITNSPTFAPPTVRASATPTGTASLTLPPAPSTVPSPRPSSTPSWTPTRPALPTAASPSPAAPSITPRPAPSITPVVARAIKLTFVGHVQEPDGRPVSGFQYVQLWGANDPELGQALLHRASSNSDGSFALHTAEVYEFYFVTLDTDFPEAYEYLSATPGPGGVWRGPREVRYRNLASGIYTAIIFVVKTTETPASPALPAPTLAATATSMPLLPAITLQEPAPDFSTRDSAQFRWTVDRPLPDGVFYEVVMWAEGQKPGAALGVVGVTRNTQTSVNFGAVPHVRGGAYYWAVILVRTLPGYLRLSQPVPGRRIYIEKDRAPSNEDPRSGAHSAN